MNYRILAAALLVVGLAACKSNPDKLPANNPFKPDEAALREQKLQAAALYKSAREALDSADFATAARRYETLSTKFPFTDYAIQGQMEKVYAGYRAYASDDALTDAEHFLRDYPRHPHADYVQYLKGLINFDRDRGLEAMIGFDTTKRDVTNLRRSFDDFSTLIQKYPNSAYIGDARQRMIALRNQIARHEETVVDYYIRRGAWVAAAKRAEQIIAQYPGAPVTLDALSQLEMAYQQLGLKDQAGDARQLRLAYLQSASEGKNKKAKAEVSSAADVAPPPAMAPMSP